jgi:drug/metabolite transporter (DMT)-like permease
MKTISLLFKVLLYAIILGGLAVLAISILSIFSAVPYFESFQTHETITKIIAALAGLFFATCSAFLLWIYSKIDKVLNKQKTIIDMLRIKS